MALAARLSISDRLTIAFAAVAILAIAANLVVEHGTTTLVTIIKPPEPAPRPVVHEVFVAPPPPPLLVTAPPPPQVHHQIDEHPAVDALRDFERQVVRQASERLNDEPDTLQDAARLLGTTVDTFLERAAITDHALRRRAGAVVADGTGLVHATQSRRRLGGSYSTHFENLDTQMQAALEGSWKIFGRVIARQSLVALSRALDDVRRRSAAVSAGGTLEHAVLDPLAASQKAFAIAVENNAEGLEKSQGTQWLADLRHNMALLSDDTAQLASLSDGTAPTVDAFQEGAQAMELALHQAAQTARGRDARTAAEAAPVRHVAVARNLPPLELIEISAVKKPVPALPVAPPPPRTRTDKVRIIIGTISVIVLFLVFIISAATVRSIARPIRGFMKITERLATGDLQVRFPASGVRELDILAAAFNRMAEKLAVAQAVTREHQAHLELSVDERTRELQHLAEHDPLTGLPNRRQLLSYLERALRNADEEASRVVLFFLDLDNFKNLNDSMGHAFGDQVLKAIAQRLKEASIETGGFAARLGGDEFTVIHRGAGSIDELASRGEILVRAFEKPLLVEGRELLVSASVGASVYPDHERDSSALMRAADAALFEAKSLGRSRLSVFSRELLENASVKFRTEQGLRRAVERGEWELLFQPEVRFDSLNVKLVEALVRWRLPDGTQVSPAEFITVAEESGLITTINEWVLRSAVERCASWHHGPWAQARVAVNVTARQLLDARFVPQLLDLLTEFRLPPTCMEIELTETVLQTGPGTIQTLKNLRDAGVSVALDDFGCGYSSLASLEQLPLSRVKLDRSLIASIDSSSRSLAIARAIIGLCASLELEVTAEGIERPEQLALLLAYPDLALQGYLIARPLAGDAIAEFVARAPQTLQELLLQIPVAPLPETLTSPSRLVRVG